MITCEVCGLVFREEDWREYNLHNNVAHMHEYNGVTYYNVISYITHTTEQIVTRDRLIAKMERSLNGLEIGN